MKICEKCSTSILIHNHHHHPKFMDNPKGGGPKSFLCEKCHNILHLIIPSIIWKHVPNHLQQSAISEVLNFTKYYINDKKKIEWLPNHPSEDVLRFCLKRGILLDADALIYLKNSKDWKKMIETIISSNNSKIITKQILNELRSERNWI